MNFWLKDDNECQVFWWEGKSWISICWSFIFLVCFNANFWRVNWLLINRFNICMLEFHTHMVIYVNIAVKRNLNIFVCLCEGKLNLYLVVYCLMGLYLELRINFLIFFLTWWFGSFVYKSIYIHCVYFKSRLPCVFIKRKKILSMLLLWLLRSVVWLFCFPKRSVIDVIYHFLSRSLVWKLLVLKLSEYVRKEHSSSKYLWGYKICWVLFERPDFSRKFYTAPKFHPMSNSLLNQHIDPFGSRALITALTSAYTPKCFVCPFVEIFTPVKLCLKVNWTVYTICNLFHPAFLTFSWETAPHALIPYLLDKNHVMGWHSLYTSCLIFLIHTLSYLLWKIWSKNYPVCWVGVWV